MVNVVPVGGGGGGANESWRRTDYTESDAVKTARNIGIS